jgi:LuxR family transcriptional regulator, maltose regulon positive regulatory protein
MEFAFDSLLLSTKLKIPAPRKNYVVRRTLFRQLSRCADLSVIFVRGGAGTGKTTLLSSFLRETGLKNVGWLSLDASNADICSFWSYFTAAVQPFLGSDGDFLALIRSNPDFSHMENLLIPLINRLCGGEDRYLVLDDVHCISDAALTRTLEFFIGNMPENFHVFMLSREDPPVYLGPLAVSGRLLFLDGNQMRLLPEEGTEFLRRTLGLSGSEEELERLNAYAEGWIGGLQLAAAAGAVGQDSGRLLRAGGGIAAEYLNREVFESLTREERDFLTRTGFLSYFNAGICSVLLEGFSSERFDEMVEALTRKNLFIICVDEQNRIYRYHNILSEYLLQQFSRLPNSIKRSLHEKAAEAFERQGDYSEALREFCTANDFGNVLRVAKSMDGRVEAWKFLDRVPMEQLILEPDLAAQCFLYNLGNFNRERCRALYEEFQEHYKDTDILRAMHFASDYFSDEFINLPEYCTLTAEQIEGVPFSSVPKAMLFVESSAALLERAQYEESERCARKAMQLCSGVNAFVELFACNQMAQICEEIGNLSDSLAWYAKSGELSRSPQMVAGAEVNYCFGLTGVYMRQMELQKAAETLEKASRLIEKQHISLNIALMTLAFHQAEMKFLCGDAECGDTLVEELRSKYPLFGVLNLGRLLQDLACAGRLSNELADRFLEELEHSENYSSQPFLILLRARILFGRGQTEEALKKTVEVLTFSRAHGNRLRLVEAGLQKVLMLRSAPGTAARQREIRNLLYEAVYYAQKDRNLMPFYLDRVILLPLLRELLAQAAGRNSLSAAEMSFLRETVSLCDADAAPREQEVLSAREIEVLNELARGITNREIADALCISQATVKTHVLSIFGKLGVSSRMMAVAEGKKRGLIS